MSLTPALKKKKLDSKPRLVLPSSSSSSSITPVLKKRKLASKSRISVELKQCSECKVYLIDDLISPEESKELLSYLHSTYFNNSLSISWTREGRREITQFSNPMNLNYKYSGRNHYGHKMTYVMNALLTRIDHGLIL